MLRTTCINLRDMRFPPESSHGAAVASDALLAAYSPYGLVRELSLIPTPEGARTIVTPADAEAILESGTRRLGLGGSLWRSLGPGGKGFTASSAIFSALGESLERVAPLFTQMEHRDDFRLATIKELRSEGVAIPPTELMTPFAPEQFLGPLDCAPLSEDSVIGWLPARKLRSGEPTLVPAQQVSFHYAPHPAETKFAPATSVGLAAGPTRRDAIVGAVNEVIERDVIGVSWHCRIPGRRVPLDAVRLHGEAGRLARMLRKTAPDVVIVGYTVDIPEYTVVAAHRFVPGVGPVAFASGTGASVDPSRAFVSAVTELFQTQAGAESNRRSPHWFLAAKPDAAGADADRDRDKIANVNERISYYGHEANFDRIRAWIEPDEEGELVDDGARGNEYDRMLDVLAQHELDPIVFEVNPKPMVSGPGPRPAIMRAMIPEFTLAHVPPYRFFGHPRYTMIRRDLGLQEHLETVATLRHEENPFP